MLPSSGDRAEILKGHMTAFSSAHRSVLHIDVSWHDLGEPPVPNFFPDRVSGPTLLETVTGIKKLLL